MNTPLRIATRSSPLARWQAEHVAGLIGQPVEFVFVETSGDADQTSPIAAIGGKGVFVKEVQRAVLDGRADLAVHSAKDLPALEPDGLCLAAVPERGDVQDCLVGARLEELVPGSRVATGSPRRRVQLQQLRPGLVFAELRGNIATRLAKQPDFDAIVMASVALERLGQSPPVVEVLNPQQMIPQVGQGALAVECRSDDEPTRALLAAIESAPARACVDAERAFLAELGGDCSLPAACYVTLDEHEFWVRALLADRTEQVVVRDEQFGFDGVGLATQVAKDLQRRVTELAG